MADAPPTAAMLTNGIGLSRVSTTVPWMTRCIWAPPAVAVAHNAAINRRNRHDRNNPARLIAPSRPPRVRLPKRRQIRENSKWGVAGHGVKADQWIIRWTHPLERRIVPQAFISEE